MSFRRKIPSNIIVAISTLLALGVATCAQDIKLPLAKDSVRFAVVGDSGTGDRPEYEIGQQLEKYRQQINFDFTIMLGDNLYGGHSPSDFARKFEQPFKPLLDAGVKFYASLGNHDDPDIERLYKPFNMGGKRYYTFQKGDVEFFALDSNYMDPVQLNWLRGELESSKKRWKIAFFHHPLFNDGKHHGPDLDLRSQLVPLFKQYGVNAVFSGHEHVYERLRPEDNIYYFVLGNSGKLMTHDFHRTDDLEHSLDSQQCFMLVEIDQDKLFFQVITRAGETIDSGSIPHQ